MPSHVPKYNTVGPTVTLLQCFRDPRAWEITTNTVNMQGLMIDLLPGNPEVDSSGAMVRLVRRADVTVGGALRTNVEVAYDMGNRAFVVKLGEGEEPIETGTVSEYSAMPR